MFQHYFVSRWQAIPTVSCAKRATVCHSVCIVTLLLLALRTLLRCSKSIQLHSRSLLYSNPLQLNYYAPCSQAW